MARTLIIRMLGLGDVASILVPAARALRRADPSVPVDVLTFGAGVELMALVPEIDDILAVTAAQWPDALMPAITSFLDIAKTIRLRAYTRVVNLDTWFMPCLMARVLRDFGMAVEGNVLNRSLPALLREIRDGTLTQDDFSLSARYMASSFPGMDDWHRPWWNDADNRLAYPDYYLRHCCGWPDAADRAIDVAADSALRDQAGGRTIVALSTAGRKIVYPHRQKLIRALERAGYCVWGQFDGSLPVEAVLARLKASDLLISLPTSTQWLAHAVGCPTLLIPGPQAPAHLRPEAVVEGTLTCQYCTQMACPRGLDFPCLDVPPARIVAAAGAFFAATA